MQITTLKSYDGGAQDNQNHFGFELTNVGYSPSKEKRQRLSVALLQTKRKISALESITQSQKKNNPSSTTSLKEKSIPSNSYQSSIISDEQFFDANSNFGNFGDNMSNADSSRKKPRYNSNLRQESDQQESEKDNEGDDFNDFSSSSDCSFYSMDDSSPDMQYEKTKQNFYNHIKIKAKSGLTSPNLQKLPQNPSYQKVTIQGILDNEINLNSERKIGRENRLQSIDSQDNRNRRRSSSLGSVGDNQKFNIMQIVDMVSPTNQQAQQQDQLYEIEEESNSTISSAMQSRQYTSQNTGIQFGMDFKKYMNISLQRSSCINQFNSKNITSKTTNDTLDSTMRMDISFLKDDDLSLYDQSYLRVPKIPGKERNPSPEKRATSSYLENRNTLQCMTTLQAKTFEKDAKSRQNNQFNKSTNYYRQRKDVQQLFTFNRILEIKRKYQSRNQEEKAMKSFTFNLTFILSCEILRSRFSLRLFQVLHIWSVFLRYYFYFFCLFMMLADSRYSQYMLPMILLPRLFYILSLFKVIFSYQNHTKSYRQVSQIFNSAFGNDDYFQIMNMNQLLTSDSFEKLTREKILARFKFILSPSELNIFALNKNTVSLSKRKDVWYFSNYILISIEYMSVYIIMIFFSIYNAQFKKEFQLEQDFSLNVYTFSFMYFTVSVILFIIYNIYYLRRGNLRLRRDNMNNVGKNRKTFQ